MKGYKLLILFAVLFVSDYALAQLPSCPCDTAELPNGTTGNDIVEALCPGGNLLPDVIPVVNADIVEILSQNLLYGAGLIPGEGLACGIAQAEVDTILVQITEQELVDCRARLIQGCGLNINPIPTLSEWGLIAMAGVLGIIALIAARKRKSAA